MLGEVRAGVSEAVLGLSREHYWRRYTTSFPRMCRSYTKCRGNFWWTRGHE
jgi:hypothetical protein